MPTADDSFAVRLARESVRHFLARGNLMPLPLEIPDPFKLPSAAFVTIMNNGDLRGCLGTMSPQTDSAAAEIIQNAVGSATKDPRFPPVRRGEFADLSFSVDLLSRMESVSSAAELDPKVYGIMVRSGEKCGVLLPDLEGIQTVQEQISIARMKGGILPGETVAISRFTVERYGKK